MPRFPAPHVSALSAIIERLGRDLGDDHETVRQLKPVARRLWSAADALDKVKSNRNPLDTPAGHALKVAKMARQLDSEVSKVFNQCSETVRQALLKTQQRIDAKVDLRPDPHAAEIRAVFRGLPADKQGKFLKELINQNRGPEMAAIVKAPCVLTGLDEDRRRRYEEAIIAKHAGSEYDEMTTIGGLYSELSAVADTARGFARSLIDPGQLSKIEREAAEADAAADGFNQSMQSPQ